MERACCGFNRHFFLEPLFGCDTTEAAGILLGPREVALLYRELHEANSHRVSAITVRFLDSVSNCERLSLKSYS
jgi:hypothetical protein